MGIGLLQYFGCIPGTWERQRLRGAAIANPPQATRVELKQWSDARVGDVAQLNSVRVYQDAAPMPETLDDSNLVLILYPKKTPFLDLMDLRQHLAIYLEADGGGCWELGFKGQHP